MKRSFARSGIVCAVLMAGLAGGGAALGGSGTYSVGANDTEILLGQTMPYSGPASAYGAGGQVQLAYWKMLNSRGGINGRKITMISLDDGYTPPKTVEQTRRLVEQDEVLAVFSSPGTPTNAAVQRYLNQKEVPQLLIGTGGSRWNNPAQFKWTVPFFPSYTQEAKAYAQYILRVKPDAKIGILYQNDDFGKDYVKGLKDGLGDKADLIKLEQSYDVTAPTIDSQLVSLKAAGVDVLVTATIPKFGAQAIRRVAELDWHPLHFISYVSSLVGSVLEPAGLEASKGLISVAVLKDIHDPQWADDSGVKEYRKFLAEWYPSGNPDDSGIQMAYSAAQLLEIILKNCGDVLTRESVLQQTTSLKGVSLPTLLPSVTVTVTPTDYYPFDNFYLATFNGERWVPMKEKISTRAGVAAASATPR
ncbi:MAG TPA: ABC transporter substrate-binding protein [Bradyrhizobium sp.]|nr:ABC transporter substrate-binding protein [Bradyrhizobium sp.]